MLTHLVSCSFVVAAVSKLQELTFVLLGFFQVRSSYRAGEIFVQNFVRQKKAQLVSTAS